MTSNEPGYEIRSAILANGNRFAVVVTADADIHALTEEEFIAQYGPDRMLALIRQAQSSPDAGEEALDSTQPGSPT
ncbi:hypothetical protein [Streptomyces triculaminicus]|uniref:hypothetical protein n=1 Tax=Streptomyces triculaminicus TaxID=2816232 RepID=UPI003788823A